MQIEFSPTTRDATCPDCGCLVWLAIPPDSPVTIHQAIARKQGLAPPDNWPHVTLREPFPFKPSIVRQIPEPLAQALGVLAISELGPQEETLLVALGSAANHEALDMLRFVLDRQVSAVVAGQGWIERQLPVAYALVEDS